MNAQDRPEFAEALVRLFSAFGKTPTDAQVDAYWHYLADVPLASVLDGIEAAGRKAGRFVPAVGQIRECIDAATYGSTPRNTAHTYGKTDPDCETCDDTGWAPTQIPHPRGYMVHAVRPCTCARGASKAGGLNLESVA